MFQKPSIFAAPTVTGSFIGAHDTQACGINFGDDVCDSGNTVDPDCPDSCGTLREIGVGVTSSLIAAGIFAGVVKGAAPGPTDIV
ncbi:MAG: hypothetical protein RBU21_00150 [FCB group bacterium]|jgi:hypothetical protein|nr:hypothetical protein [FCB group bacterium]